VKELTTLYQVSRVLQKEKLPVEKIIPEILQVLPSGWQYAGDAVARIVSGDKEYSTPGFREGAHRQTAAFNAPGGQSGMIEIVYLEPKPPAYEDAFMAEERSMITMVAEMLGNFLSRRYEADMNIRMQQELLNRTIQEQKTVTRAVLTAEEKERNKIGQELHDNVNQILASVNQTGG
jgi:signal transduction histidine kinase